MWIELTFRLLRACTFCAILCTTTGINGQQLLNGSFEMNDVDCGINFMNGVFNDHVSDVTAFGGQSEIDLLSDACGYDVAVDGAYFVGLYYNTFSDALSFTLTLPLSANRLYRLNFAARTGDNIINHNTKVQIGVSNSPDAFGELVYTSPSLDDAWLYYAAQFSLTTAQTYLTVRITAIEETWAFLDDFSLDCPEINLGHDTAYCVVDQIILEAGEFFESYLWNDLSVSHAITVNGPGTYWVEATDGNCIVGDTIVISELPFQCDCRIFLPSIFSPNGDGVNDEFRPLTPCDFLEFQFSLYDRWGRVVYTSFDPEQVWDGKSGDDLMGSGVYVFVLRYRFYYQSDMQFRQGDVTVLR